MKKLNFIFEKYDTDSKGKYIWTSNKELSFKIKNQKQINVLGSLLIKKSALYIEECQNEEIENFGLLKKK